MIDLAKAKTLLRIASDVLPKLPGKDDSFITLLVKALAIADSIEGHIIGKQNATMAFFSKLDFESMTNPQFVDLFFSTPLKDQFTSRKVHLDDHTSVIRASHATIGTLYFLEHSWGGRPEYGRDFWYSKEFDFRLALDVLWTTFNGGIHASVTFDQREYRSRAEFTQLPEAKDPLLGDNVAKLEEVCDQHVRYRADKLPRTYLFIGKQGTGKTTFAIRMSQRLGLRTLRIDAKGLTGVSIRDLDFLVRNLGPDFVIVDDIDRVSDLEASLPTLFGILTDFKTLHSEVTIIMTANDEAKLPAALVRPGRVDDVIDFPDPTVEDRRVVIEGYLKDYGVKLQGDLGPLLVATDGLTPAYLKEVAIQLRYRTVDQVLAVVTRMQRLAKPKTEEKAPDKAPAPETKPAA